MSETRPFPELPDGRDTPPGGWLQIEPGPAGAAGVVDLTAEPDAGAAIEVALRAAQAVGRGSRPGPRLTRWLADLPPEVPWTDRALRLLPRFLADAQVPVWRFLLVAGTLDRVLPDLAGAVHRRFPDAPEVGAGFAGWPRLDQVNRMALETFERPDLIRLAALVLDAGDLDPSSAVAPAGREPLAHLVEPVAHRLGLGEGDRADLALLVGSATFLPAAARDLDGLDEEPVVALASRLGSAERAEAAWILAATTRCTELERDRLATLRQLVATVLAHPEHTGVGADDLVARRKAEAVQAMPEAHARIAMTPRAFVLSQAPTDLARQAALADPPQSRGQARAAVAPAGGGRWRIDVALADRVGLLALQLDALRAEGLRVLDVATVVWPDRQSLSSFRVEAGPRPDGYHLAEVIARALRTSTVAPRALPGATVTFDDESSPWHTVCTVVNDDRSTALAAVAHAVALCDLNVVAARAGLDGDRPLVVLELLDRNGGHPGVEEQERVRAVLATGHLPPRPRRASRHHPRPA